VEGLSPGVAKEQVIAAKGASLIVSDKLVEMPLSE
jgi:hypothetical protein